MSQILLLGLGGTGSRVVNNVALKLAEKGRNINSDNLCCAVLDTNENDNNMIRKSAAGVPVFPTSRALKIRDYLNSYNHMGIREWCPESPAFLEESMVDGASELRVKSRIAFMDSIESGTLRELESMINRVVANDTSKSIRVMIVSSLSGGTGSGMFIQVALWIRQLLSRNQVTIRGIFMLPDVFISTIRDIAENQTTVTRHYCNAYAAIRELNALSMIKKDCTSDEISGRIKIGSLFDSEKDMNSGVPVFDFSFFVDYRDENGIRLGSIGEYERAVAQLVYMQLYAPMAANMRSEEDNAFLAFQENEEPLYGSCGTSMAEYPVKSVRQYCVLKGIRNALGDSWRKIDDEIEALEREQKERERDGIFSTEAIDFRKTFIKLFNEKTSADAGSTGRDRFFTSIARDVKNERISETGQGKTNIIYTDKVTDFINTVIKSEIDRLVTTAGNANSFAIDVEAFSRERHTKENLLDKINTDSTGILNDLKAFGTELDNYSEGIINRVFPLSMGDVNAKAPASVYGLLSKSSDDGGIAFIHPVAARYVLYKLVSELKARNNQVDIDRERMKAESGSGYELYFDNERTGKHETTPEEYLESRVRILQPEDSFYRDFAKKYGEYVNSRIKEINRYKGTAIRVKVFTGLIGRINGLIEQLDGFFRRLPGVREYLEAELQRNISETDNVQGKTLYIYAGKEDKEKIFSQLDLETDGDSSDINKSVIDAVYGAFCAEKRPSNEFNREFSDRSVADCFLEAAYKEYSERTDSRRNSDFVNIDIFTALSRETDRKNNFTSENNNKIAFDLSTGKAKEDNTAELRYTSAFAELKNRLYQMAAPMLIYDREIADNKLGTVTSRTKTFWGYNPELIKSFPRAGEVLGINADIQSDEAYGRNELYCYRAIYGLESGYIPNFNEGNKGIYYESYMEVINKMISDAAGNQGDKAYVRTPHLDKTWHSLLPYVTGNKNRDENLSLFRGLWLAVAYKTITSDKNGRLCIVRRADSGFGNFVEESIPIEYNGRELTKTDVLKLINYLKTDDIFRNQDIAELEKRFAEELENMENYVSTAVMKGLTTGKDDLNPINVIVRYNSTGRSDRHISAALIGALEQLAEELVCAYESNRSERQIEKAKFTLCRRIYDSSTRVEGRKEIFGIWERKFEELKIGKETKD